MPKFRVGQTVRVLDTGDTTKNLVGSVGSISYFVDDQEAVAAVTMQSTGHLVKIPVRALEALPSSASASTYASTAEYLTWDDAQAMLGLDDRAMNALVSEGKLKAYRKPEMGEGSPVFKRADVEGFKGGMKGGAKLTVNVPADVLRTPGAKKREYASQEQADRAWKAAFDMEQRAGDDPSDAVSAKVAQAWKNAARASESAGNREEAERAWRKVESWGGHRSFASSISSGQVADYKHAQGDYAVNVPADVLRTPGAKKREYTGAWKVGDPVSVGGRGAGEIIDVRKNPDGTVKNYLVRLDNGNFAEVPGSALQPPTVGKVHLSALPGAKRREYAEGEWREKASARARAFVSRKIAEAKEAVSGIGGPGNAKSVAALDRLATEAKALILEIEDAAAKEGTSGRDRAKSGTRVQGEKEIVQARGINLQGRLDRAIESAKSATHSGAREARTRDLAEILEAIPQMTEGLGKAGSYSDSAQASASSLPGGAYAAEQAADGSWTVHDVPIFAEHEVPLADGKRTAKVDCAWLQAAVEKSHERESGDKYLAPVHVRHHGGAQPTEPAGFFRPTRVGQMQYEGRQVAVLFADLVGVPDATYQEMKAGHLPYRSVEVHDIGKAEVNSLALLQDEVPFFRLPMLTIGAEQPAHTTSVAACAVKFAPMLAFAEVGARAGAYLYSEASMRKYNAPPPELAEAIRNLHAAQKELNELDEATMTRVQVDNARMKKERAAKAFNAAHEAAISKGWKPPEFSFHDVLHGWTPPKPMKGSAMPDDKKPDDAVKAQSECDEDEDEIKAAAEPLKEEEVKLQNDAGGLEAKIDKVIALLTQLCDAETAEVSAAAEEEPGLAPAHGTPANASALQMGEVAALKGRLAKAENRVAQIENEAAEIKAVASARKQLQHYAVAADIENDLRYSFRMGGVKMLAATVASIKKYAVEEPGEAPGEVDGVTDPAKLPAALRKYVDEGPDALKAALTYAAEFEGPGGRCSGMTLEKYVAGRFAAAEMSNGTAFRK